MRIWIAFDQLNGDVIAAFSRKPSLRKLRDVCLGDPKNGEADEFLRDLSIDSVELYDNKTRRNAK